MALITFPFKIDRRGKTPKPNFDGTIDSNWPNGDKPEPSGLSISSVSGTFAAGSSLTIDGSFTAKRNGQLVFLNFEGDQLGAFPSGIQEDSGDIGASYSVSDSAPLFGTKYARCHAIQESPKDTAVVLDANYRELFMESWARVEFVDFTDPEGAQLKSFRAVPKSTMGEGATGSIPPAIQTIVDSDGIPNRFLCSHDPSGDDSLGGSWYGSPLTESQWLRWTYYSNLGDLNTANGKRYIKVGSQNEFTYSNIPDGHFASPSGVVAPSEWDGEGLILDDGSLIEDGFRRYMLPFYTRTEQETIIGVDRVYINDSPERVVVGDASTWLACSHDKTFILKQGSRSTSQIVAEVDTVGPLSGLNAYLYVFNSDGEYNANGVSLGVV